jgi:uncharacterized protein YegJ (DUF2314 family)
LRIAVRLIIIVVALVVFGISRYNRAKLPTVSPNGAPLVHAKVDDPRLAAATAEARRRWPEFVAAYKNRLGKSAFVVKHEFPLKDGGAQHMWMAVTGINGNQVSGLLIDQPYGDIGYKEGDPITLAANEIEDWGYQEHGQRVGGFSQPVLEAIEAEQGRK